MMGFFEEIENMKINLLVSENNIAEIQLNKQKGDKENLIWMSQEDAVQLIKQLHKIFVRTQELIARLRRLVTVFEN